jgi:hypothetical protein
MKYLAIFLQGYLIGHVVSAAGYSEMQMILFAVANLVLTFVYSSHNKAQQ